MSAPSAAGTFVFDASIGGWSSFVYSDHGDPKRSQQMRTQSVGVSYLIDPGDLGVPNGSTVRYSLSIATPTETFEADRSFVYQKGHANRAVYTYLTSAGLVFNGFVVPKEKLKAAAEVGEKVNGAVVNYRGRSQDNPTLIALADNPLALLSRFGLPEDFFASADPGVLDEFLTFLREQATEDLGVSASQTAATDAAISPASIARCWACRIGLGAVIVAVGVMITQLFLVEGAALYVVAREFLVGWGLQVIMANAILKGALGLFATAGSLGIAELIAYFCQQIPDTCPQ